MDHLPPLLTQRSPRLCSHPRLIFHSTPLAPLGGCPPPHPSSLINCTRRPSAKILQMSPGSPLLPDTPYGSAIADWDPFVSLLLTCYLLEKRTTVPAAGPQMLPQYYHQPHQMQHEGPTSFCFKAWASTAWSGGRGAKRPGLATTRYQQCHHPAIPQGIHLKAEALAQPREQ